MFIFLATLLLLNIYFTLLLLIILHTSVLYMIIFHKTYLPLTLTVHVSYGKLRYALERHLTLLMISMAGVQGLKGQRAFIILSGQIASSMLLACF